MRAYSTRAWPDVAMKHRNLAECAECMAILFLCWLGLRLYTLPARSALAQ